MPSIAAVTVAVGLILGGLATGPVLADNANPVIAAVSPIRATANQTITISGSGFGTLNPYHGDSSWLKIEDLTANWTAGYTDALGNSDGVTTIVASWTNTSIVISGLAGIYGSGILNPYVLSPGDTVQITVWNPETGAGTYIDRSVVSAMLPPTAPAASGTMPGLGSPTPPASQSSTSSSPPPSSGSTTAASGSVFWSVSFTETNNQITIPCTIDNESFRCFIDTGNGLSLVVPASVAGRLRVSAAETFSLSGVAGTTSAFAGPGTIVVGGDSAQTMITVAARDSIPYPNIGMPLLAQLCEGGQAAVQIDWMRHTISCGSG